jgi:hypothetical protein
MAMVVKLDTVLRVAMAIRVVFASLKLDFVSPKPDFVSPKLDFVSPSVAFVRLPCASPRLAFALLRLREVPLSSLIAVQEATDLRLVFVALLRDPMVCAPLVSKADTDPLFSRSSPSLDLVSPSNPVSACVVPSRAMAYRKDTLVPWLAMAVAFPPELVSLNPPEALPTELALLREVLPTLRVVFACQETCPIRKLSIRDSSS